MRKSRHLKALLNCKLQNYQNFKALIEDVFHAIFRVQLDAWKSRHAVAKPN